MEKKNKRITVKLKCPNPLFQQWLTEWLDQAKEKNSRMQHCYNTALKSLQKYPLPLNTGKDCKILHGFGDTLCKMLDDKLMKYKNDNLQSSCEDDKQQTELQKSPTVAKCTAKTNDYIPKQGSGGYAILITLYENSLETNSTNGYLTKSEIIEKARYLSKKSFTRPDPGSYYTAWSSMRTLIEKDLVKKQGNPARFNLTSKGVTVANKLYIQRKSDELDKHEGDKNDNQSEQRLLKQPTTSTTSTSNQNSCDDDTAIFTPNSFQIILLVDNNEVSGKKYNLDDEFQFELHRLNVNYEVRNLKVGDYVWICRNYNNKDIELVLPYIIERKRMDDFSSSIKDGRFYEQKYRLKQSGIQNCIYLVEDYGRNQLIGLPISSLYQAAINTAVQDGFIVKFTKDYQETAQYLSNLSKTILKHYKSKTIVSCTKENLTTISVQDDLISLMKFEHFNKNSTKTKKFKIKDLFVRQLLQIKGLSVDKALAIVEKYPTPKCLKLAFDDTPIQQREKLLSTIKYGDSNKNVGAVLTKDYLKLPPLFNCSS